MNWFYIAAGGVLIVITWIDAVWTTLWVDGHGGPFTVRLSTLVQRLVRRITPGGHHRLLTLTGPLVLTTSIAFWTLLLWGGFFLLFNADPKSVVQTHSGAQASWHELLYFTGYTLFTLGNGDYSPQGAGWQLATTALSGSGFVLIGLTVTYLLSLLDAVVHQRSFSSQVTALGNTAEEFLTACWTGDSFARIELQILSLTQQVNSVTERLAAYPMLHYYHSQRRVQSLPVAITVFDQAMFLLARAVHEDCRPAPAVLNCARRSIQLFFDGAQRYVETADQEPPAPDLAKLRAAGIPLLSDAEIASATAENSAHRRLLKGYLNGEKREWPGQDSA